MKAKGKRPREESAMRTEDERLLACLNLLNGAQRFVLCRLRMTEGNKCECGPSRDVEADGPCNWCEQMIFAWDLVFAAAYELRPLVKDGYQGYRGDALD